MEYFRIGMDARDVITASNMNEIVDAVNWTKSNRTWVGSVGINRRGSDVGIIRVKLGRTLGQFSAVVFGDAVLTEDNCATFTTEIPTLNADTAGSNYDDEPFGIIGEPGSQDSIVRAVVSGCTPAKVTIKDANHGYAKPVAGDTSGALESSDAGTARILWKAGNSGEQWCYLSLGSGGSGSNYDGPFKITYDASGQKLKIGSGYINRNGEFLQIDLESISPESGILCINQSINGSEWASPKLTFATPDKANYPIGEIKVTSNNGAQSVSITQYYVTCAIFILTAECAVNWADI